MITVTECVTKLLESAKAFSKKQRIEHIQLADALGRILGEDIHSNVDVPPADNSAMDGYAVNAKNISVGAALPISQRIPAGAVPKALQAGTAARIFTGAQIPEGADTVIMQENCSATGESVTINELEKTGANIRRRGQDISHNQRVLAKGTPLRAQELGLLASTGCASVPCYAKLNVAIINTGDELMEPGQPPEPGKIYNSNRILVQSILKGWGFETHTTEIVADDFSTTKTALEKLANKSDIIISTGGVSVGEEDHIKPAVEALGSLNVWKVAIKPGKPFAFGEVCGVPFLGLPGNPASVFATLLILARPYLLAQQGASDEHQHAKRLKAKADFSRKAGKREEYLRAKIKDDTVEIYQNQSSGMLSSACWGDCFVVQEKGEAIQQGDDVRIVPYASLFNV